MMRPARLEHAPERLDQPVHDPAELEASLDHVAAVNRWLGGRRALLRAVEPLLPSGRPAIILDVGTGSGDLPRVLVDQAVRLGFGRTRPLRCVALDRHAQILEIARRRCAEYPEIQLVQGGALALPFGDRSVDVAIMSLTLHHFEGEDQVRALRELARVVRCGMVVNELERSWPNYLGARLLASTLWRRNRLTRHDGPRSVLRAFAPAELFALARRAGLREPRIRRFFPWRVALIARSSGQIQDRHEENARE